MKEFETFRLRQQMMHDAHREQIVRLEQPNPVYQPVNVEDTEQRLAELRKHIQELRGNLPNPQKDADRSIGQLKRYGR